MDSLIVYTAAAVSEEDLHAFVGERGGYWNHGPAVDEGVIEYVDGALYIGPFPAYADEVESHELISLTASLGTQPAGAISIHIPGGDRLHAVAARVAREIAARWQGYVYGQDGDFRTAK